MLQLLPTHTSVSFGRSVIVTTLKARLLSSKVFSLVRAVDVPALGTAALVGVVLALVPVDAERAAGVQLVAARTDALEAAVGVLAGAGWWAHTLMIQKTSFIEVVNHRWYWQ